MSTELIDFLSTARHRLNWGKVNRAMSMLRKEKHLMFIERTPEGIAGIVKSQTNKNLEYSVILNSDGNHICGTQNLRRCGGLRGGICKHCIMLTMAAVKSNMVTAEEGITWLSNSVGKYSTYNKPRAEDIFARFQNPTTELEFRSVEITAEDFMAF